MDCNNYYLAIRLFIRGTFTDVRALSSSVDENQFLFIDFDTSLTASAHSNDSMPTLLYLDIFSDVANILVTHSSRYYHQ